MKLKRVLSLILATALLLSFLPTGVLPIRAETAESTSVDYKNGYTWSFDQNKTFSKCQKVQYVNSDSSIGIMFHDAHFNSATVYESRDITNGIYTAEPHISWGLPGQAIFYKLPAALEAGKTYYLDINLYAGSEGAKLYGTQSSKTFDGITVSVGDMYNNQKWRADEIASAIYGSTGTMTAVATKTVGNNALTTNSGNVFRIELPITEELAAKAAAGKWLCITYPTANTFSYKLGNVSLTEVAGYWDFAGEATNDFAEQKSPLFDNSTIFVSNNRWANGAGFNTHLVDNGMLTYGSTGQSGTNVPTTHIGFKLPANLKAGQRYTLTLQMSADSETRWLHNDAKVGFFLRLSDAQSYEVWHTGASFSGTLIGSVYHSVALPTSKTEVELPFMITEAVAEQAVKDKWLTVTLPMQIGTTYHLYDAVLKETKSDYNYFVNGDFSSGDLDHWATNYDSTYVSVQDSVLNVTNKVPSGDVKLYQSMYLEAGTYRLSFDVKGAPASWRPVYFMGTGVDNASVTDQKQVSQEAGKDPNGWWKVTREITITTAGTYNFQMYLNTTSNGASVAPAMQYDNFDLRKLLDVTTDLSNATLGNTDAKVAQGLVYETTVSANEGYNISNVTVTMGGKDVTNAYDAATGKISIPVVSGALEIKVETVKITYEVTVTGDDVQASHSNDAIHGESYTVDLTTDTAGKKVNVVSVKENGSDKAFTFANNTLTVENVTGSLVITAELQDITFGVTLDDLSGIEGVVLTPVTDVVYGQQYVGTLTLPEAEKQFLVVEVTMGGTVVPGAYSDGTVTVPSVTDAVVVKVTHTGKCQIQQNCANSTSNKDTTVIPSGTGFAATYTAKEGYKIIGLTYTVGGVAGDAQNVTVAADGASASINLTNITGDVVITVTTEAKVYEVITNGEHVTNSQNSATHDSAFSTTLTPDENYAIKNVTVSMGGQVVSGAYSNGTVTIANVTGSITITVETIALDVDNLIWNGNFELGTDGWSNNGIAPMGSIANGVLSLPTEDAASGDARTYNMMQLAPGTYQISFDVKGTSGEYRPYISVSKNYWSYDYGQYFMVRYSLSDTEWTTITEYFTVPASAADATTGLAPVYVTVWNSTTGSAPVTEMYLDNFEVRACVGVTVENTDGGAATGLKDYTVPYAVTGRPFELVLQPLDETYGMTVSYIMGNGTPVQVSLESDGSAKIWIDKITGDLKIIANTWKSHYRVETNGGGANSNNAQLVANGSAYNAVISSASSDMKLYSVTCTMGGINVPVQVVNGEAVIDIAAVSGDIVIQASLVDKNTVAHWVFDVTKAVTGKGEWGDAAHFVKIAHNSYYDTKNEENNRPHGTTNVAPDLLTITTNLPSGAASWADASTVIGYKLPENLELGATYTVKLPIYAGNDHTTMASSMSGSNRSGVELVFTTEQPNDMWNANHATLTKIYAEGAGVLAAVAPSIGKLPTDSNNVFSISFTVTEEIMEYAVAGNYLALIINHQHKDGIYKVGNASLLKITDPATVTVNTGDSICDGAPITQKGKPYTAQIAPRPGYKVVSATYTMGGGAPVALTVENGAVNISIENVTGDIVITAVTEQLEIGNLLVNGSFILGEQFWSFDNSHFSLQASGGSDALNDPAFIQAAGKHGGILSQPFEVEKNSNYELIFRYKGTVPQNAALWAIASKNTYAWNTVLYKGAVSDADGWTTVRVVFNSGNYTNLYVLFRTEEGSDFSLDNVWIKATDDAATVTLYKRPILGTRPNPSPYDDYPYVSDIVDNLMPDFGFESDTHYLENAFSKVEADENAWEGSNSLHYATVITGSDAKNMLTNGDFANWDAENKTIDGWQFQFDSTSWMHKIDLVEIGGRRAVKLNTCTNTDKFRLELTQKVYLEAGFTYKFSFDFYGVANWGPNLPIYDANMKQIGEATNSQETGKAGEWTTLTKTFTPTSSGYYYFAARMHNDAYPQREQYVSNCTVTLISKAGNSRLDYQLKDLEANTDYWLTLFVKAPKVDSVADRFITFGLTDPETGDFILMTSPDAEGGRPYKVGQQLVPMAYDGQWHLITVPFNTGDATWLNFTIDGTNCEAWFDNIYIFKDADAKKFVSPATEKEEATVTDEDPDLLGCDEDKNLFDNFDLNGGNTFWGADAHRFGVFGNALYVTDSGSRIYGNALHYVAGNKPTNTYYIKWIDVEPNTEYTFSAKYAITRMGEGFIGLINGYRVDSTVTENRLFPTMIAKFGFGADAYLESQEWQNIAISFNSGERNRIGFVVCDAGGEAYIDELRLFKSADGIVLNEAVDNFPTDLESSKNDVVIQDDTVTGITSGTTLENVLKSFENSEYIRVFDAKGNEVTEKLAKIGTGAVIRLMDGPAIKDSVTVIIKGDVNGDALIDGNDTAAIVHHITGKTPLTGAYLSAADVDGDGKVTVSDAALNTRAPAAGALSVTATGPNAFAQKEEIEILLTANTSDLKAISGKLTPTDGLTFVKAEGELDGWELSVKRSGKDVYFAFGAVSGKAAKAGDVLITLSFRVGMISTYDEAQLAITQLLASTGADLLTAADMNWMRQAPVTEEPDDEGPTETVPKDPVVVAARNRLKELSIAGVKFSPDFDPEIKEYTATVPFEIDKVTVKAVAMDDDAVVTIGDTNLEYVGKNTVAIRVVSADGLQRTYKIIITREAPVEAPTETEPTEPGTTEAAPTEPETSEPNIQKPEKKPDVVGIVLLSLAGLLLAAMMVILIIILKNRKYTRR